jgi:hypothetical protein
MASGSKNNGRHQHEIQCALADIKQKQAKNYVHPGRGGPNSDLKSHFQSGQPIGAQYDKDKQDSASKYWDKKSW